MKLRFIALVVLLSARLVGQTAVSVNYGATGLSGISYGGFQYLANGNFRVNAVNFVNAAGQVSSGSTTGTATYDAAHQRTTLVFSWGKVVISYAASGGTLNLTIGTYNASAMTLQGIFYEPLDVQFPAQPQEFDGVDPILAENLGSPTALRLTAGSNAVVLTNNDVVQPLLVGFPWALNSPSNTAFPIRVETSQDPMLPNSIPYINRPIAPKASDTYHLSLRFGAASAPTKSLVADLYQKFATVYPFTAHWEDRRPIGQLIAATTAAGFPTNPRGWFNDPTVDVTNAAGIAAFQARLLTWAQGAVAILKSMNAQGMITWDIEGEQYPQPTTYIGDPAAAQTLAPEMAGVIDQYFQTFTGAGLRIGVCIRPQKLTFPAGGGAPTQVTVTDPTSLLMSKIGYAYKRWGATLFYIDSNGDPNYPMTSAFFQKVAAAYPNVLLIPEHQTASYFAFGSWYGELKGGATGTPQPVLDIYPSAFSVIYLPDGPFAQDQSLVQAAIARGDIAMFRAWYADPQNQEIFSLYPSDGVAPPSATFATPGLNSVASETLAVSMNVQAGPAAVSGVQYLLDGAPAGVPAGVAPYAQTVDISSLSTGSHHVQAVTADALGDLAFTDLDFFIGLPNGDPPPEVAIAQPSAGAVVAGETELQAKVSGNLPIVSAQFTLDGELLGPLLTVAPFTRSWDSRSAANGSHCIGVNAVDQANSLGTTTLCVIVQN